LVSSDPADGAQLAAPPAVVSLQFNQPVNTEILTVKVTGPTGEDATAGPASVNNTTVSQPLKPVTTPGKYEVVYRIVSEDGHPVAGKRTFTLVAAPATPVSAETPAPAPVTTSEQASAEPGGTNLVPWILLGLGGLLAVGAGIFFVRRLGR
jgi:hypothetical protein